MEIPVFRYMRWAKTHAGTSRLDLTGSGMPPPRLPDLLHPAADRRKPAGDGDAVLHDLLAERYGVPASHVLFVPGTTLSCFLLAFALLERGAPVLVETPAYENFPGLVRLLGGEPVSVPRLPEDGYRLDPERFERGFRSGVRLAIVSDLHNPTGVHARDDDLEAVRAAAARHGATVLVDEVYRDHLPGAPGTAYRPDRPGVVAASSLTKVYGLGALRTGWILCPPDLRERAAQLLDYLTVLPPAASAAAAEHVLRHAERYRAAAHEAARAGLRVLEQWVATRDDARWVRPDAGLTAFLGFEGIADTGALCRWLRDERDTAVVPGSFFADPGRIRICHGADPALLEEALGHLSDAVQRHRA